MKKIVINSVIFIFSLILLNTAFLFWEQKKELNQSHNQLCSQENIKKYNEINVLCSGKGKLDIKNNVHIVLSTVFALILWGYLITEFVRKKRAER